MSGSSPKFVFALACLGLGSASANAAPTLGKAPIPAPTAASPLKEIGRVHARTAFCQAVYDRGSVSTSAALDNDVTLATTSQYLDSVELDENKLGKPNAEFELQRRYAQIMNEAQDAIEETKSLRQLAEQAPTPEQKAAIVAYADALGGALHRQQLVAEYFRRFVMYLQTHEAVPWQQRNEELFYAARTPMGPFEHSADPRDRVTPMLTEVARSESLQITDRHQAVTSDEAHAAAKYDAAFGPCAPAPETSPVP